MNNPIRNRIAEHQLKQLVITCKQNGCKVKLPYHEMNDHIKQNCQYLIVECKYEKLGCNWKGCRAQQNTHQHNIELDDILNKFHVLERQKQDVESINEGLEDDIDELYEEINFFKQTVSNSNITGTFSLRDIWKEFNEYDREVEQVYRFCGDIKKAIQVILSFKIDKSSSRININCKLLINCLVSQQNRNIQAIIRYIPAANNHHIYTMSDNLSIIAEFNDKYVSDWYRLASYSGDCIEELNQLINRLDAGVFKIFAVI